MRFSDALDLTKPRFAQAIFEDGSTNGTSIDDRDLGLIPLFPRRHRAMARRF